MRHPHGFGDRRPCARAILYAVAVAAALADPRAVAGQDAPGKAVTIDLSANGTVLQGRLPFDVPFIFSGAAEGIELILYRRSDESRQPITSCAVVVPPVEARDTTVYVSAPAAPTTDRASGASDKPAGYQRWYCPSGTCKEFQLVIQKLEANRFYCFQFLVVRRVAASDTSRMLVANAIGEWTRERLDAAIPTPDDLDVLRRSVLEAIRNASATSNLAVLTDSVLGDRDRFAKAFQSTVQVVLSAHRETNAIDKALASRALQLTAVVNTDWLETAFVIDLFDRVDAKKDDAAVAPYAATVTKVRSIRGAHLPFELQGISFATAGEISLATRFTSADRATARKRLTDNVIAPFEEVRRLLLRLETDDPLRTALAVTDAEVQTARAHAVKIANELATLRLVAAEIEATESALARREKAIADLAAFITLAEGVGTLGHTVGDFNTRKTWYISMDLGLAVAPTLDSVFPYAGMNVYLSPVNKDAPVNTVGWKKRFAFLVGVSYATDTEKIVLPDVTEPVLDKRTVIAGAGYRVLDSLRVTAGVVLLREIDPNPLLADKHLVVSPFFGMSIDWNAKSSFLDKLFGTTPD